MDNEFKPEELFQEMYSCIVKSGELPKDYFASEKKVSLQLDVLAHCIERGYVDKMQTCIDAGVDVNAYAVMSYGVCRYVELAAYFRKPLALEVLLKNGAKINLLGSTGQPIDWAARDRASLDVFIKYGADYNRYNLKGHTFLIHLLGNINRYKSKEADIDFIIDLIDSGVDVNKNTKGNEMNPLLLCVINQNAQLLGKLLEKGASEELIIGRNNSDLINKYEALRALSEKNELEKRIAKENVKSDNIYKL